MKQILRTALFSGLGLSLAVAAVAQHSDSSEKIPGFFNPKTHMFTAQARSNNVSDAATSSFTGTLKFEYTVKLDTVVSSGDEVICVAGADVLDDGSSNFYEEAAERKATVSGSTATCSVPIPYSWSLSTSSTDMVDVSYSITISPTSLTSSNAAILTREHESSLTPIKVPTSGATTTINISATI